MLPKRRFWKHALEKCFLRNPDFIFCQTHAPQTKILEGRTNFSECIFEALFKGVSALIWDTNR
jgi:hypothetical protein